MHRILKQNERFEQIRLTGTCWPYNKMERLEHDFRIGMTSKVTETQAI
jgi:hypothetical protein